MFFEVNKDIKFDFIKGIYFFKSIGLLFDNFIIYWVNNIVIKFIIIMIV